MHSPGFPHQMLPCTGTPAETLIILLAVHDGYWKGSINLGICVCFAESLLQRERSPNLHSASFLKVVMSISGFCFVFKWVVTFFQSCFALYYHMRAHIKQCDLFEYMCFIISHVLSYCVIIASVSMSGSNSVLVPFCVSGGKLSISTL